VATTNLSGALLRQFSRPKGVVDMNSEIDFGFPSDETDDIQKGGLR
jgi:hypothetical protein